MNARAWCVLALALTGCSARLSSSLPTTTAPVSYVGVQAGVFDPATLERSLERVEEDFEELARDSGAVPAQLSRAGSVLKLRLGAAESFAPTGAELLPSALPFYARLADTLRRRPGTVAHVLVHGDAPAGDPAADLTARRAAALRAYLVSRGVPETRLRAEGRGLRQPATADAAAANVRVEVVIQPIVAGREAQAWMPPA